MTNGLSNPRNHASSSSASTKAEKRKEYQKRYYAARKENNKVSKFGSGDAPQSASSISLMNNRSTERTPLRSLQTNITQFPQTTNENASSVSTTKCKEYNEGCSNTPNDNGMRISNGSQVNQTPIDDVIDVVRHRTSRGIQIHPRTLLPQFAEVVDQPSLQHGSVEDDPYNFVYNGVPGEHRVLKERGACPNCGAKRFQFEFDTFCCMSGKTVLANLEIPEELYRLFTSQDEIGDLFRQNIRAYNTNFSFASMGVTLDDTLNNMRDGVYTFRAHKGIYHRIDQLVPRDGTPRYLQLYFYDPDTELDHRLRWPNLDRRITQILTRVLSTNPYVDTFRRLAELGPLDNYRVTLNTSVELDQRVYNRPTTSEFTIIYVAGIWVEGNDNITSYKRSIVVYGRSEYRQTIQPYFSCYDPLSYPLFFPNGESGWHANIPRQGVSINEVRNNDNIEGEMEEANTRSGRTTVAMREYYCYKFQIRSTDNVLLFGGRLLQQFVVDVYIKIETSRLEFCERNQDKIRAELYQGIVDCVNTGEVHANRVGKRIVLPASFIGGPRDIRRRFLDAMTLVQDDGKPDVFLTMTCNPKWPEICDNLHVGQTATDRPDLVSRVFRAKLEDLKDQLFKKHVLGEVKAYVYVIEFQKRGLPHAHFLLIMYPQHKINNADHYDKVVCAEIPNKLTHPRLHEMVVKHMIHGPCGNLRSSSPCMQGDPKICRFHYPRQFNEQTTQGEDSYPLYRRRDTGIEVDLRGQTLDNRWMVPYNPRLLMMFNCHMNVEVCSSIKSVKYLFKYVYKGHDKQVIQVDQSEPGVVINEIKRFQDARYISPPEAMWRIFSFSLSQIFPAVLALQLHLPNNQMVRFRDDDLMPNIVDRERDKRTMLTAFFDQNRNDETARVHLYKDFPKHFTWNGSTRRWSRRFGKKQRGRIVSANPAEGERYYLRLLLSNVRGPTSFEHLCTVNGQRCATFRKAALELGLIEDDEYLSQCLEEASTFQFPNALRRLFATIMIFCQPGDIRKLWNDHFDSLSEDHRLHCQSIERVQNMVLTEITVLVQSMGKNFNEFDLPKITDDVNLQDAGYRELQEEYGIVLEPEHLSAKHSLNPDQKNVFDEIMMHVDNDLPGVFFIDGPGGTGKTFLYIALLAEIRSRGLIALATASSGAAANNMPGGRTVHSRFKIPLNLENNSMCNIKKQSGAAKLIRSAKIIIWDEASMAKRQAIEAVDRTFQDIIGVSLPFGGKIMVMGGDFRHVLPVIKRGTRAQILDSSVRMSPLWSLTKKMQLTINMRALKDPWFSKFLLRVGDGTEEPIEGNYIRIPDDMTIQCNNRENAIKELIHAIFPSIEDNVYSSDYIISRAILSTKNDSVDEINNQMIEIFQGEEKVYYSFDEAEDDQRNFYPVEFLNSLNVSGLPPHKLHLKIGCPIILLRNIDPSHGLCNGTRLICKGFMRNVIDAEIAVGQHAGKRVFFCQESL
ncbi:uncharacterized protein LOC110906363 [Helianthus annuus]|uniref:uncharacterized protein LOC110906363 n=1 Tax=Helianthus annuus TaxID=4232 RepID=UPI001652E866|nr:uncharacterized protein LOC110906363 [Helianthus annuus]